MKSIKFITAILLLGFSFTSCIQDEEPNAEADITACILPKELLTKPEIDVYKPYDEALKAYPIYLPLKPEVDVTSLAPEFQLTEGATIVPESGSKQNFTDTIYYNVTSEDRNWVRTYAVIAQQKKPINPDPENPDEVKSKTFHFETAKTGGKYHILYEDFNNQTVTWSSGNGGYALAVSSAKPTEYPTFLSPNGKTGNCVEMVTRTTGSLGLLVGMPIASGNLFIGEFKIGDALSRPLEATKFGESSFVKPIRLKGYYQYKAGSEFLEKGKPANKKDMFSIYAIFYESTDDVPTLDGNIQETNFEHPNMVALAIINDAHETKNGEWQSFDINFDYKRYGKTIDEKKLKEGKYHLGIVFAASKDGANFNGAPGSTLKVDEMEIVYQ